MTRLWSGGDNDGIGLPITVQLNTSLESDSDPELTQQQEPFRFTWGGQRHEVTEITKTWRVDTDWWRGRIWRAYFKLTTDTGLLVIIYQDLMSGKWYLQRLYD